MTEAEPATQKQKLYTKRQLQTSLDSNEFTAMQPNYKQEQALRPEELTVEIIDNVVDAVISTTLLDLHVKLEPQRESFRVEIPDVGVLEVIGTGEYKTVLLLTTLEGKRIVVSLFTYQAKIGIQVPEDSRFTTFYKDGITERAIYSNLATYLVVPVQHPMVYERGDKGSWCVGVAFQEYAPQTPVKTAFAPLSRRRAVKQARRTIRTHAQARGWGEVRIDSDIEQERHHFVIGGRVAIIDVNVEFRK